MKNKLCPNCKKTKLITVPFMDTDRYGGTTEGYMQHCEKCLINYECKGIQHFQAFIDGEGSS